MAHLQDLANDLGGIYQSRANRFKISLRLIKALLLIGAVAAGIAHFFPAEDHWHSIGIMGAIVVFICGVVVAIAEPDPGAELEKARRAIGAARDSERELALRKQPTDEAIAVAQTAINRATELYQANAIMRGVIQEAFRAHQCNGALENTIRLMISLAERSLKIAAGFESDQHWTLCVYKAEYDPQQHRNVLRCCAAIRSVPCDLADARPWPEGIGTGGIAFAQGTEEVEPDTRALEPERYKTAGLYRDHDRDRYRSIVGVPIISDNTEGSRPWGVVVATSDRPNHFKRNEPPGFHRTQAARTVAELVAHAAVTLYSPPTETEAGPARGATGLAAQPLGAGDVSA